MDEQVGLAVPRDHAAEFVVRLAEAIGARAGTSSVYSRPVSQHGTTVIPVARAMWGFGGGQGLEGGDKAAAGTGGGGGALVTPVGYLVLREGRVSYHRITRLPALLLAALAGAATMYLCRGEP